MACLPIKMVLADLKAMLNANANVVLIAPPGAGKTTQVPLALLGEAWLAGRRILMLEPRRIAAKAAARYMANLLGEATGQTVGYRVRLDACTGRDTKIEVVTEGVLTRMIQTDPALEDVGLIIFDEFHERSLQADLGLALCLQAQTFLRQDLKLLVMSATMDAEPVAAMLNNAPVMVSEGRSYSVQSFHNAVPPDTNIEAAVTKTILKALALSTGDILVFLPGIGEIRRTINHLKQYKLAEYVKVLPLHGGLPPDEQDAALLPARRGCRKIVLATAIAETSLTVEGVEVVIDSGLMRVPRFAPRTGMTHLATVPVSLAAAKQRQGRAGRLGPGLCFKLWSKQEEAGFSPNSRPEIYDADLTSFALELAAWGVADPAGLSWLDCPPRAAFSQACALLSRLGALDPDGTITAHGRAMASLSCQPRLAHMMLKAVPLGLGPMACEIAALLSEQGILRRAAPGQDADLRLRLEVIRNCLSNNTSQELASTVYRPIRKEIAYWKRSLNITGQGSASDIESCGLLLALAYPDRIAQSRGDGRFLLQNGRGARLAANQLLAAERYIVAVELDDKGAESHIYLAIAVSLENILQCFSSRIYQETAVVWDRSSQSVRSRSNWRLGAITLKEAVTRPPADALLTALLAGIATEGLGILPWTKAARQFQARVNFLHYLDCTKWPDMSDSVLLKDLNGWLAPFLTGITSREELKSIHLLAIFEAMFTWQNRQELEELAPACILAPSGRRILLDYSDPAKPVLAARLQELFGLTETPRIAGGKVPLTLQLLSPACRPVQVTTDLASFWRQAYYAVKRDLAGRYPKHYWPDDPLQAMTAKPVKQRS